GIRIARLRWARRDPIGVPVFDLDAPDNSTHWTVTEGDLTEVAFFRAEEAHHALTHNSLRTTTPAMDTVDDALTGTIESAPFVLDVPFYTLLVGGGNDRERTYVAIIDAHDGS